MRHARTILLFGFLGAAATILIAWMFAVIGQVGRFELRQVPGWPDEGSASLQWPVSVPRDWPACHSTITAEGRGVAWASSAGRQRIGIDNDYHVTVVRFGWPMLAMRWVNGYREPETETNVETIGGRWITLPDRIEEWSSSLNRTNGFPARRKLPLDPVWAGFLFDAAFFGGGLWLALRGRGALRRSIRRRRRQCLDCGYPIGKSPICTECGRSVRRSAKAADEASRECGA